MAWFFKRPQRQIDPQKISSFPADDDPPRGYPKIGKWGIHFD